MPVLLLMLLLVVACSNGDGREDPMRANLGENALEAQDAPQTFDQQVELGAMLFAEHCAQCHGDMGQGTDKAPRVVGLSEGALPLDPPPSRQLRKEQFVTVGDVANFVVMNMPANAPGSLMTDEYLAILAFDLQANGITLDQPLTLELADNTTIPR